MIFMGKVFRIALVVVAVLFVVGSVGRCGKGSNSSSSQKEESASTQQSSSKDEKAEEEAKAEAEKKAKAEEEAKAKAEAEEQSRREAEEQAKREAEEQGRNEEKPSGGAGSQDFNIQDDENLEDRPYGNPERTVYVTKSGHAYHSSRNCPTLARSKNIIETTVDEARSTGHDPCDVCC